MTITTYPCPIPKITDPQGKDWNQPAHSFIKFTTDGFAIVHQEGMKALQWYDHSTPSAVYSGKIWGRRHGDTMYLCWYEQIQANPPLCEMKFRKILPQAVLDLLDPPDAATVRAKAKGMFSGFMEGTL